MTVRLLSFSIFILFSATQSHAQFDSGRSTISVAINNEIYPYNEFATFVLPREEISISVLADDVLDIELSASSGDLVHIQDCRWSWTAPAADGITEIEINRGNRELMTIRAFGMVPGSRLVNSRIDGVIVGNYPEPLDSSPIYQKPDGFIKVTQNMLATAVSPHFVLGQFVSQENDSFPKYIVLRERLLLKLEVLAESLNEQGFDADSLAIVSGYLSPAYNASIRGPEHSRHIYGGAATLIIDSDGDGAMDDLNGDGNINQQDGQLLFDLIDELYSEPGKQYLQGGLYLYTNASDRGPMVMIDARGFRKRWGAEEVVPPVPAEPIPKPRYIFR